MEFTLNIVYGGELNASKALSPFVRNMRKIIKDTNLMIKNGDLILNKLAKYKYAFDINSYKHCVDICSKKMNDIVNEI